MPRFPVASCHKLAALNTAQVPLANLALSLRGTAPRQLVLSIVASYSAHLVYLQSLPEGSTFLLKPTESK